MVPATPFGGGRAAAIKTLQDALARFRAEGLEADGAVGNSDPATAAIEAWDPMRHDQIIVSTLPIGVSKWLRVGLPARIGRLTGALVTHVASEPPKAMPMPRPAPTRKDHGPLIGALSVLSWGGSSDRTRIRTQPATNCRAPYGPAAPSPGAKARLAVTAEGSRAGCRAESV